MSYIRSYVIESTDITLHHTSVTFDAHLGEILGTTIMGAQLILLQPNGHLDMEIFAKTIQHHQVTYLGTVPSQITELIVFLRNANEENLLKTLRCISSGGKRIVLRNSSSNISEIFLLQLGETLFTRTVFDIIPYLNKNCHIYNFYGPAECTEAAIGHLVTKDDVIYSSVSLGQPMANVRVHLVDEYLQPVIPGMHIGEIVIGGEIFSYP